MSRYSEDILIEQPAMALFAELGWETANCFDETFGPKGTLGRETSSEVVLLSRLIPALDRKAITVIAKKIRNLIPAADITEVMSAVEMLLDESIIPTKEGYVIGEPPSSGHYLDLSKIDFESLKTRFERGHKRIEAEKLRGKIPRRKLVEELQGETGNTQFSGQQLAGARAGITMRADRLGKEHFIKVYEKGHVYDLHSDYINDVKSYFGI